MKTTGLETPSGKRASDENFPVGSLLLASHVRPHVAIFYKFARAADDVADNPHLSPEDKIGRLDRMAASVVGRETGDPALDTAHRMRESLAETVIEPKHCLDLLAAFKQDAIKQRYGDWSELMDYCELSANPVGRYLLDLHGESQLLYPAADALCTALQVINHLQDVQADYHGLDRVYLPQDWLEREDLDVSVLDMPQANEALRRVLDLCLDGVADLLEAARILPDQLTDRRLAAESAVIVRLAMNLEERLRQGDPLAERVVIPRLVFFRLAVAGALGAFMRRGIRPKLRAHCGGQAFPSQTDGSG